MKQSIVYTFIGVLVGIFVARSAIAQSRGESEVPRTISYQGMVSSATGAEFPSGDYAVTVRLYADEDGREVVWEGEYRTRVENGLLNLELGSGDYPLPGSSAMDRSLWIGIQVGEGPEMTPRTRLSAVPYALTVPDGSVTFDKLGVDYVSSIMIDGEKVTGKGSSLNITGGEGVDLRYDRLRGSMQIDLRRSGEDEGTRRDGEKGGSTQTPNSTVYWSEAGNRGTTPGTDYVGTSDAEELEIHVNSGNTTANAGDKRVMLYDPQPNSPNLIGGYQGNLPGRGSAIEGATIGGGGRNNQVNEVKDDYGTIGGGVGNIAGGFGINSTTDDIYATVGGGRENEARAQYSTVGGGGENEAQANYSTVGGGWENKAKDNYTTVGGGYQNQAQEYSSTVGGGYQNQAQEQYSTVGGGRLNQAQEYYTTVGGGYQNQAQEQYSTVGGGRLNQAQEYYTTVGGGHNNYAQASYSTVGGGRLNQAQAYYTTVGGGYYNYAQASYSTVGGGYNNRAQASYSTVGGGRSNETQKQYSTVGGGRLNQAQAYYTTVGGGHNNYAQADYSTVGGGDSNQAQASYSTVGGGYKNEAQASYSTVGGGYKNEAQAGYSTVGGGYKNEAQAGYSTVGGGRSNETQKQYATVGGGHGNKAKERYTTVGGGYENEAQGYISTVGGGYENEAQGYSSTVGGGYENEAQGDFSTVGGGYQHQAQAFYSTVGGGYQHQAQGYSSTVGGGYQNQAQRVSSTVGGGWKNQAQGYMSTVGGGRENEAQGSYSTVGGGRNNQAATASAIPGGRYLTVGDNSFGFNGDSATTPTQTDISAHNQTAYFGNVDLWIGNVDSVPRELRFYVSNNGNFTYSGATAPLYVGFKAPQALDSTRTTSTLYTLPTDFPSANGALLSSSTTGTLSWSTSIGVDTDGDVGIGTNNPDVSLDVDGGLAIRPPAEITITQDNDTVDPGDRSFLQIDSDGAPANRTITLAAGKEGQILVIQCTATGTNGIELLTSASTHTFTANKTLQGKDALTVIWNGLSSAWYEIGHTDF